MEQNKPLFFGVSEEDIKQQEAAKQQEQERIATELENNVSPLNNALLPKNKRRVKKNVKKICGNCSENIAARKKNIAVQNLANLQLPLPLLCGELLISFCYQLFLAQLMVKQGNL